MANEKEVDPELVKRASFAYNPHPKDVQAPALDAGLVERMLDAARVDADDWRTYCSEDKSQFIQAMAASLRVAADALLGPVTDEEWETEIALPDIDASTHEEYIQKRYRMSFNELLASRHARLLAPARSAEDRVTLRPDPDTNECYDVLLDGKAQHTFCGLVHAKRYMAGLIATLKQEPRP